MPIGVAKAIRLASGGAPPAIVMPSFVTAAGGSSNVTLFHSSVTNHEWTFTVPSGVPNAKLLVLVSQGVAPTVASVTWDQGGVNQALTFGNGLSHTSGASTRVEFWWRDNPTAGASKTIRAVQSTGTGSNKHYWAVLVRDAEPGAPLWAAYQAASAASVSGSITVPAPGEALLLSTFTDSRSGDHTANPTGSGHVERFGELHGTGYRGYGYKQAVAVGGHTLGWAQSSGTAARHALGLVGIEPVS